MNVAAASDAFSAKREDKSGQTEIGGKIQIEVNDRREDVVDGPHRAAADRHRPGLVSRILISGGGDG